MNSILATSPYNSKSSRPGGVDLTSALQSTLAGLGELRSNEPMGQHTTLGVGGPAQWYFRPAGYRELIQSLPLIPGQLPLLPLGRGSNLLITDGGFPGMVVDLGSLSKISMEHGNIRAMAGARMPKVAQFCADKGLTGLEFMATVPGDIGGGIAMNAGAFGQQVSDTLTSVSITDREGTTHTVPASDLCMDYRQALLPPDTLILGGTFAPVSGEPNVIRQRMRSMRTRRSASQPLALPNCGSVFKNPPGAYAAALIEEAGLKGMDMGNAAISDKHANFIINKGQARSSDILALIHEVQTVVEARFNIRLEPELKIIGNPD